MKKMWIAIFFFSSVTSFAAEPANQCDSRVYVPMPNREIKDWPKLRKHLTDKGFKIVEEKPEEILKLPPGTLFAEFNYTFEQLGSTNRCIFEFSLNEITSTDPFRASNLYGQIGTQDHLNWFSDIYKCDSAEERAMRNTPTFWEIIRGC